MAFMENKQWKAELKGSIRTRAALEEGLCLRAEESAFFDDPRSADTLPFRVTGYYLGLAGEGSNDPIRRQCIPTAAELEVRPYEAADPLNEAAYSPVSRLVRRYPDRALLLVNDTCAAYCRHCFRRGFTGRAAGAVTDAELAALCGYLQHETGVKELLLSGGDPLLLDDERLSRVLEALRSARPDLVFRLATRVPVTLPSRITAELASMLAEYFPLWVVTQFNHPVEITAESSAAVTVLRKAGLPVLNQTVLLKGINDHSDTLARLFCGLVRLGVKPYYLFQGDLAAGTGHFRTTLEAGWRIMEELRGRLSGMAVPAYAVDLPGGGGKIVLDRGAVIRETTRGYTFRGFEGDEYTYPKEHKNEQRQ